MCALYKNLQIVSVKPPMKMICKNSLKWLIPTSQIGAAVQDAYRIVREFYREHSTGVIPNSTYQINSFFKRAIIKFSGWGRGNFNALVNCCTDDPDARFADVHQDLNFATPRQEEALSNFFKMVFVLMWSRRQVVLPLSMRSVTNQDEIFEKVIDLGGAPVLKELRSLLHYDEQHATKHDRDLNKRAYTRWTKLLLSGQVYSSADLTREYCVAVYKDSLGRKKPLAQYRVLQFLYFLAGEDLAARQMVEEAVAEVRSDNDAVIKVAREKRKKPKVLSAAEIAFNAGIKYGNGVTTVELDELFAHCVKPYMLKSVFDMQDAGADFYVKLPREVRVFCAGIDASFRSFVKSKRLQNEKNHILLLNLQLAYLSTYLPNFFLARDGDLSGYPTSFNDYDCVLYFTRESNFVDGVLAYEKKPPMTFLGFLEKYAKFNDWGNETWYARVLCADEFCEWIQEHRHTLANADRFSNNFSAACYPPIRRRNGTVKRPVPRAYFGAFVSMLYSMEYLIMHLNMMAEGEMPGVIRGVLYQPSLAELQESSDWESMWGRGEARVTVIDQSKLNYCPIFYCDGKIYTFNFLPRFYRIIDYQIGDEIVPRAVPNHVRLTLLMCETGLRQKHLIWLDKDRYDCMLDRSSRSQLSPLFVSTDKSHGEWTAIVARHVMSILDRQRKWYGQCSAQSYKDALWYGNKENSKFGKLKPLFRMPLPGEDSWACYRFYPVMLSILQYFIRNQLNDLKISELVFAKAGKGEESIPIEFTKEFFADITVDALVSDYTPHGLRAGFVSEAVRFLPAWMVGQYLTGQSEPHVWYYSVFDEDDLPSHQKLLAQYLLKNTEKLNNAEAPELAAAVIKLNARLAADIKADPVRAIKAHGLISLIGVKEDQSGIEILRARKDTAFAYNPTHICPFNNKCPKEILELLGAGRPCGLCPYAIRGVCHLPAISAEKDKCKELMAEVLRKLKHYRSLRHSAADRQVIETLSQDHDTYAREAFAYEAVEQQLYQMALNGQGANLFAPKKDELVSHFKRVELTHGEHVVKRLVDVQNFPDASSAELDTKFAYLRAMLLIKDGDLDSILNVSEHPPGIALASQISSMVNSQALDVMDVFKISQAAAKPPVPVKPDLLISRRIGHSQVEKHDAEPEKGYVR
ncbi:hypothetical protein [Pseudomonas alloputida]|uniref:hypothetical protein n=1 Tax=Pseudomonas TaxID=286 RepID=UPI003EEB78D0